MPPSLQTHLERFRRHEPPVSHDQLGAALLVQVQVQGDQPVDHLALALAHLGHVHRDRARDDPELRGMVQQVGDFRAPDLVLAGQAVDVRTGPADPAALDDRNAASGVSPGARPATCRPLRCQAPGLRTIPAETCVISLCGLRESDSPAWLRSGHLFSAGRRHGHKGSHSRADAFQDRSTQSDLPFARASPLFLCALAAALFCNVRKAP